MNTLKPLLMGAWLLVGLGCSNHKPPVGRWEGTYDSSDVMIAVRLEILRDGSIYLSAPDAFNFPPISDAQRQAMHDRLASNLAAAWSETAARSFEFDGHVFRKAGGVAPQMEWDPTSRDMTVVVYLERRPGIPVPLHAVKQFASNPWSS